MDIILYLRELLQTRKTIGIAGLGTLYKKKTPGRYDTTLHAFVPPTYHLSFTTEIKEEIALPNYISSKRNISIESANYYITEFVEQIHTQIADHQEADLDQIGKLRLVNDELTLIPDQDQNFGFEFFGLPTLTDINPPLEEIKVDESSKTEILAEIEEENKLEEENPGYGTNEVENDEQPIYDEIAEVKQYPITDESNYIQTQPTEIVDNDIVQTNYQAEVEESELTEDDGPKKGLPFFIKFLIVIITIVAVGAIAYFINPQFFDKYIQQNFEGKPAKNVPIPLKDSLNNKIDSPQVDSLAKNNNLVSLVKDSTVIDSTKKYYEVIGTSERTKLAADKYIARVAKKGIIAKHLKLSKGHYTVSIGTFNDEKEALKYTDSLRKLLKNPGIYSQPIKPKKSKK